MRQTRRIRKFVKIYAERSNINERTAFGGSISIICSSRVNCVSSTVPPRYWLVSDATYLDLRREGAGLELSRRQQGRACINFNPGSGCLRHNRNGYHLVKITA